MPKGSDYLSGEDELTALLLAMVLEHGQGYSWEDHKAGLTSYLRAPHTTADDLDSYDIPEDADAMIALEEQGLIEIVHQERARIWAKVTPEGRALLERLSLEQKRMAAASWQYRPAR